MSYLLKQKKLILLPTLLAVFYNLYFGAFGNGMDIGFLLYADLLAGAAMAVFFMLDIHRFYQEKRRKEELLRMDSLVWMEFEDSGESRIARHDAVILQRQLEAQFRMNCDLQDYMARWLHEVKLPLSAALLMNEKIADAALRHTQKEQLERIRQQLNMALLGAKAQSSLFDLQVRRVNLLDCVKTSVHNNQFFLIQKQFQIDLRVPETLVYTDRTWLVYLLDQLVQNAVKYAGAQPMLKIYTEDGEETVRLFVEDNGEGILESDVRRIFERGYTGSSHHNGKYKSTGMGLYLADTIAKRLEHPLEVESVYGEYTRFAVSMRRASNLTKM